MSGSSETAVGVVEIINTTAAGPKLVLHTVGSIANGRIY